jgi:D-proline reductase (dithiol) PrdB
MEVDSFAFLPRSFRPLYERPEPLADETEPVWAPLDKRLAEARVALVSSAGLYVKGSQEPFDADRERREPEWGDPSWRSIPADVATESLGMTHLHVNADDVLADHNIALPATVLDELVAEGIVGGRTDEHFSVMGYQEAGLRVWRNETAPAIASRLRDHGADAVVLAPV